MDTLNQIPIHFLISRSTLAPYYPNPNITTNTHQDERTLTEEFQDTSNTFCLDLPKSCVHIMPRECLNFTQSVDDRDEIKKAAMPTSCRLVDFIFSRPRTKVTYRGCSLWDTECPGNPNLKCTPTKKFIMKICVWLFMYSGETDLWVSFASSATKVASTKYPSSNARSRAMEYRPSSPHWPLTAAFPGLCDFDSRHRSEHTEPSFGYG